MRDRLSVGTLVLVLALIVPAGANAASDPPYDHVSGGNVLPPGNTGHIPAPRLADAIAGSYVPENADDQRALYTEWGLKDWSFAKPGEPLPDGADPRNALGSPLSPAGRSDVTIYLDGWGVPRVFADTDAAAQFGVGYAMASQRLFQADIFRRVARGEMASFIGGQEWYDYDRAWRAEFYTDAELLSVYEANYAAEERAALSQYVEGINAYIDEARLDPNKMPAEYVALALVPEKWELRHALSIYVLQSRDSVEGFGRELYNDALLRSLESRLGPVEARKAFDDLRFYNDLGAYTTAPVASGAFPYPGGGFDGVDAPGVARMEGAGALSALDARDRMILKGLSSIGLARRQASNAITVSGDLTADGRSILLGGPQLAYLAPSIFWEFEVHSPGQHARGLGFAGTAGVVLIGKSAGHAWSITYGYTDQVDVFLVPLDPARPETHYLRDGMSKELESYDSTVVCKADQVSFATNEGDPGALCDGLPAHATTVKVVRVPEYGPVIGRTLVSGQLHAIVKVRGHWMREVANGKPFLALNSVTSIEDIRDAVAQFNISLNINYVDDDGNVGFWHVAAAPIRAAGTDVRLPTLGDGNFDWQGFVDPDDIPHAINPAQGYTANWNNKVGAGWHNGDQNWWGELHRVNMLARRMEALAARGAITPEDIWQVNREAAPEDARVHDYRPFLLDAFAGHEPDGDSAAEALAIVAAWDAQRTAHPDGGEFRYDDAAVAIWDRFMLNLQHDLLAAPLGPFFDGDSRFSNRFSPNFNYPYMTLAARILRGGSASLPPAYDWLDGRDRDDVVRRAFEHAVQDVDREFDGPPSTWLGEAEVTEYRAVGLLGIEAHPVMNRGTYNQLAVVEQAG